ncbi:VOC family protein [Paenibacillus lycopersici]|uniref:VOC family protein n=1 Tax=Paenibacillus lycopersici TaxID=2704462 RepID=A0A6C0FTI9_9BACL|nr:VOC family protein [Paenibacillus lycopersici]QHT58771.1 VOC family protein [Paenibacillus lycopersici]
MVALQLDDFDGGFIIAPWERFKELVTWYRTHLDLEVTYQEDHPVERMATLKFPAIGAIHVKSVEHDHPHYAVDWGRNGNVRFCFTAPDLEAAHAYMRAHNIETTDIDSSGFGRRFDFYDPIGNRLTAIEPEPGTEDFLAKAPHARFAFQALPRFGVGNLQEAIRWYEANLGAKVEQLSEDGESAAMVICREGCPVFLETLPPDSDAQSDKLTVAARPYWVIRKKADFYASHNRLKEQGLDVTDVAGNPKYLVLFHTYDLYGNQINVWSYEDC